MRCLSPSDRLIIICIQSKSITLPNREAGTPLLGCYFYEIASLLVISTCTCQGSFKLIARLYRE